MAFPQALTASLTLHPAPVAFLVGYPQANALKDKGAKMSNSEQ